jgi:hypothetical protein
VKRKKIILLSLKIKTKHFVASVITFFPLFLIRISQNITFIENRRGGVNSEQMIIKCQDFYKIDGLNFEEA